MTVLGKEEAKAFHDGVISLISENEKLKIRLARMHELFEEASGLDAKEEYEKRYE